MAQFDWDHLQTFIAVARYGRLTAAASKMGSDHSTISRRITGLEHALKTILFDRTPAGYALNANGERLLPIAEQIESLTILAADAVGGTSLAMHGTVRIAGPEGFGSYFLATRLGAFGDLHPNLNIQLLAGPNLYSLSKREADIVITLSRPQEGRLFAAKLTDYALGLYASRSYLERSGPILSRSDLERQRFVGYVDGLLQVPELHYSDQVSNGAGTRLESSNLLVQVKATTSGAGLCILPAFIANTEPELVSILPHEVQLTRSFWMVVHADHKDRSSVRATTKFITEQVRNSKALFQLPPAIPPIQV